MTAPQGLHGTRKDTGNAGNKARPGQVKPFIPRAAKFEGKSTDLKGHIYDCSDARQSDQFIKTTREIAEYVGRAYKYGGDARLAVETLTIPRIVTPPDPAEGASKGEERIWEKSIDKRACQAN